MIYNIYGNPVTAGTEVSTQDIKAALIGAVADGAVNLGAAVGAVLPYTSPGAAWEGFAGAAYRNLLEACKAIPNSGIPFFISTDQHGRGLEVNRWLNNTDTDGLEVLNLNLGDTVNDTFGETALEDIRSRTWQIKNFISVVGNHEIKEGTEPPDSYVINRAFLTTMDAVKAVSPQNCCAILDGPHNCKILAVDTNIIGTGQGLTTAAADWVIEELGSRDSRDILWLNHWPLFDSCRQRDDTGETAGNINTITGGNSVQFALWQVLLDRKKRSKGTYTDAEGVSHPYDFSGCQGELLCCLHGHVHEEWFTTAKGLTAYAADMCGDSRTCTFGLIDRMGRKVTFWVFDSSGCQDPLVLSI